MVCGAVVLGAFPILRDRRNDYRDHFATRRRESIGCHAGTTRCQVAHLSFGTLRNCTGVPQGPVRRVLPYEPRPFIV